MKSTFFIIAFAMLIALATASSMFDLNKLDKIASEVNNNCMSTWKAEVNHNWFAQMDSTAVGNLFGARNFDQSIERPTKLRIKQDHEWSTPTSALPDNYMTYDNFPECSNIIKTVTDQSACGSCWAVSAVQSASERYCIANKQPIFLSARQMLGCCQGCGDGCDGGWLDSAMDYIVSNGLPTGSPDSLNKTLCVRYPFPTCMHHTEGSPQCSEYDFSTPSCARSCDSDSTYPTPITQDIKKGKDSYAVYGEANMMKELYEKGSIAVAYSVYEDFMTYKSGIYKHTSGGFLGGHAVTLSGWGVDAATGTKYWVVKNNWNKFWGMDGYFRIVRGQNDCSIESEGSAVVF